MKLKDKVAVVTASTEGIGLAIAELFAKEGALVYLAARNLEKAQGRADAIMESGGSVKIVHFDALQKESITSMIDTVIANEGRIDVLVNNFGTSDPRKDLDITRTSYDEFLGTIDANLGSVFIASQAVIPHMAKNGGGSIINISSIGGTVPDISQIGYGTSKAAINYLTELIAVQAGRCGVRCNAVLPGITATRSVESHLTPQFREFFLRHIPIKRMALPVEVAHACLYFASDDSAYTTGQILSVHGGFGIPTPIFADMAAMADKR